MPVAQFNSFNSFTEALAEKVHDFGNDEIKIALTNVAPVATNTVFANITEIAAGNGYTAGGEVLNIGSSSQTGGLYEAIISGDNEWTAVTAAMATFRYVVAYNNTASNKELISFYDYGSAVSLDVGNVFRFAGDGLALFSLQEAP